MGINTHRKETKMKNLKMLYLNGDSATFESVEPTLENYYNLLNCDCIDITCIRFGGKRYDVICDDEGLLKTPSHFSIISKEGYPMIAGNALICLSQDGQEKGLSKDDVVRLSLSLAWTTQNNRAVAVIVAD